MQERLDGIAPALGIPEPSETPSGATKPLNEHPGIVEATIYVMPMVWKRAGFNKKTGMHFTATECRERMDLIRKVWLEESETYLTGPLGGHFEFVFERDAIHFDAAGGLKPERIGTRPGQNKGDLDNLVKLVKDALSKCAYGDDAQVAEMTAVKRWADPGESSHTRVALWPI